MAKPIKEQVDGIIKHKREKSLEYSIKDGAAYSAMVGFGENYISAFAIALKATNNQIAVLSSVPQLLGYSSQMLSATIVDKLKNRKKMIVFSALMQGLMFLPILLTPFIFDSKPAVALILFVSMYYLFGNSVSPSWNSLMGDLVEPNERGSFFGRRSKVIGITIFMAFIAGGIILRTFQGIEVYWGFAIIFGLALLSRLVSVVYLSKMYEPPYEPYPAEKYTFRDFFSSLKDSSLGTFTFYLVIINFAIYISNPFFIVYMFRTLNFSYMQYTIVTAVNVVATFTTMLYWGKYGDRFGNKRILSITGWLLPLNPLLWLLPFGFWYIFFVQIWTGFVWAGFNISSNNFIFDMTSREKRAKTMAYYNFLIGLSIFTGATLGGLLATHILLTPWIFLSNLQILFLISGSVRLFANVLFLPKMKEVREVKETPDEHFIIDLIAVKPMQYIMSNTITGIKTVGEISEKSFEAGKKIIEDIEEGIKIMNAPPDRVTEINDILKNIDFTHRAQKEKELGDFESSSKKKAKQIWNYKKFEENSKNGKK